MAGPAPPTPALAEQARRLAHGCVRHGAKANRRQPPGRLVAAVGWIAARERLAGLDPVGKRHVAGFWKARRHLAGSTAHACWLALRGLRGWLGRTGEPPRPRPGAERPSEREEAAPRPTS
jgi:hypothetical protein